MLTGKDKSPNDLFNVIISLRVFFVNGSTDIRSISFKKYFTDEDLL